MRRNLIAANWKMHKTVAESTDFARALLERSVPDSLDLLLFPPFLSLPAVCSELSGSAVATGAQDLSWETSGAFTGEVSAGMIADVGATHVLVGHSERRHVIGESDEIVAAKLGAALDGGLTVVLCVGETVDTREAGKHESVVAAQLDAALNGKDAGDLERIVVAYEPVWAIGTGRTATPEDAQEMHRFIRSRVADAYGEVAADGLRVLYGGSVKPDNAGSLLGCSDIDGALVGGASLEVESFVAIATAGAAAG